MYRLCAGLNTLGVLDAVKNHRHVFRPIFVAPEEAKALCADTVNAIFKIRELGEEGSNARVKQLQVIGYWRDLLEDIEGECQSSPLSVCYAGTGLLTVADNNHQIRKTFQENQI